MTGRQLMAALVRECDGDDAILDLPVELDLIERHDDDATADVTDVQFDSARLLLTWAVGR